MPQKTLRIFISSPGDVAEERDKARAVIESLQRHYPEVVLKPILWEELPLPATATFQETIEYVLEQEPIDIAIFILWSRLGTPLGPPLTREDGSPYRSGTEREFDLMLHAFEQSGRQRPIILAYSRDDKGDVEFHKALSRHPSHQWESLIEQRKLAESFVREQFTDAQGRNIRAYHLYREPVNFAQRLHTHLRNALDDLLVQTSPRWLSAPYRGLEVFDVEHAPIFYGRDEETCDVLQRLRDQEKSGCAFTVIVGASGSGKSSLARGGVAATLKNSSFDDQVKEWRIARIFPSTISGDFSLGLVSALAEQVPELSAYSSFNEIGQGLSKDPQLIVNLAIKPALQRAAESVGGPVKVLLLVDQLEELWTDRQITGDNCEQFLEVLEAVARSGQIAVLATLRSDFYPHAQKIPTFLRLKGDRGHYDLLPPGPAALHRLITEPARLAGLRFEREAISRNALASGSEKEAGLGRTLDELILQDASRDPAALPLLQYALSELYEQRDEEKRLLTFAAYQKLGGVEGALGKRAADTFHSLPPEVQAALSEILPQLVTIDIDGEQSVVRRRAPLSSLTDTPNRITLTEALITARFLTTDRQDDTPIVSLAHEALLRRWDELSQWVASNREHLRLRARAEQSQQRWSQQQEDPSLLLPAGIPLDEGQILLRDARSLIKDETAEYIERSILKAEEAMALLQRQYEKLEAANTRSKALLAEAAQSDRLTARDLWDQGRHRDALAHWARSLDYEPDSAVEINTILTHTQVVSWHRSLSTLTGHESYLYCAAFSPDGTRVVTASEDGTARVWDAATGRSLAVLTGHKDRVYRVYGVYSAEFSPDGTRIVTASDDGTARVWDATTGRSLAVLTGHKDRVYSAAFSPDGTRIVTASSDGTARVWDATTGRSLAVLTGHKDRVLSAAFSPDGTRIVTASDDGTARVWDATTGRSLSTLSEHKWRVLSAVFSPDGTRIVTASWDKTARLWDAAAGHSLATLSGHENYVHSAAFSPDGTRVVTASEDGTARVWDAATGKSLATLSGHEREVHSAAFSPDGTWIITASMDKTALLWDAANGASLATLTGHEWDVISAAFSPDGTRIVTASRDYTARVWDAATGKSLATLIGHEHRVRRAEFSPDGEQIFTTSSDKTARLWDAATGQLIVTLSGHDQIVLIAWFSSDGPRVVTASEDGTARVWDATTGRSLAVLTGHKGRVLSAAFSPDGSRIVTASDDTTARLWDATTGRSLSTLTGHESYLNCAAFSSAGTRIVTASEDGSARVWDAATGQPLATLTGHMAVVTSAAFSSDGTQIVTASWEKTARVWDAATGKLLVTLSGHEHFVERAAFSPDGTRIITASSDKTARLWDAATGKLLATLTGHESALWSAAFSPDGTRIVTASDDQTSRIWDVFADQSAPPAWFKTCLRFLGHRTHISGGVLADWPSSNEESKIALELQQAIAADQTRYGDIARYLLTPHPAKPTHPWSKVTCGEGASQLIRPTAIKTEIERAYDWYPGHPLAQIALAKFEENTTRAEFLREYGVSRLLKRLPSDQEPAAKIAELCRRAEALLLDQNDQPRADRVRQRAEELQAMGK